MSYNDKAVCNPQAGQVLPEINLSKCEGKRDCVSVCPYNVFEMQEITSEQYKTLSFTGKVKTLFHGRKKAFAVRSSACQACGLCVTACPEKAIKLVKALA